MPTFIALKRPGPPAREVLVNLDQILMVQPGQGSGSAILFGREHQVSFEEDVPTVIRRIQNVVIELYASVYARNALARRAHW